MKSSFNFKCQLELPTHIWTWHDIFNVKHGLPFYWSVNPDPKWLSNWAIYRVQRQPLGIIFILKRIFGNLVQLGRFHQNLTNIQQLVKNRLRGAPQKFIKNNASMVVTCWEEILFRRYRYSEHPSLLINFTWNNQQLASSGIALENDRKQILKFMTSSIV